MGIANNKEHAELVAKIKNKRANKTDRYQAHYKNGMWLVIDTKSKSEMNYIGA